MRHRSLAHHMADNSYITVTIGGDFAPLGRPEAMLLSGHSTVDQLVGAVRPLFAQSDIGVVNLECPLIEGGTPISKEGPAIHAHPETTELLAGVGVHVATLANNHIRDFGDAGVVKTISLCVGKGIRTVGAGLNLESARQPLYMGIRGRTVAFVNVAEQEYANATPSRAGANPLDLIDLLRDLHDARSRADHVILIVHSGLECVHCPSPESIKLLRFLAEQGVTAVIRHHAHYVQGYEIWKGVPIFYSLGNLLFEEPSRSFPDWFWGLVVTLTIARDNTCAVQLHPVSHCEDAPAIMLLEGQSKGKALRDIAAYSGFISDEKLLAREWNAALLSRREDYHARLVMPSFFLLRICRRLGLKRFLHPSKWSSLLWLNYLRCATHREALIDILRTDNYE